MIAAALAADRARLALRGPAVRAGVAVAAVAGLLALALPGLDPEERAKTAVAALSGLSTALGGLVVAAAGAARFARERASRRLAVDRAGGSPRSALVFAEAVHLGVVSAAVALVATAAAAGIAARDPLALPRLALEPASAERGRLLFEEAPPGDDLRLAFTTVARCVPPDVPPRVVEAEARFPASGRTVRVRLSNDAPGFVGVARGDLGPNGRLVVEIAPTGPGLALSVAGAKLLGRRGSAAYSVFAFGLGVFFRLEVIALVGLLTGMVARPALAALLVATVLLYGLFGGAAAGFAEEFARHGDRSLPWDLVSAVAGTLHAALPDLARLSTAAPWVRGEAIPLARVADALLLAALLCGGLCAICIALSRRQEVLSPA